MVREANRVRVKSDKDVARVLDDVHADGEPRIVEKDGEEIAAVVPVDFVQSSLIRMPTRAETERSLAAAGGWKGLVPDDFGDRVMERRHASPPSPPVRFDSDQPPG